MTKYKGYAEAVYNADGQTLSDGQETGLFLNSKGAVLTSQDSGSISADGVSLTPKFAAISASSSGDNTVVAAVTGKKIRVLSYVLTANAAVNGKFKSGASTDKSGLIYMDAKGGAAAGYVPVGHFETASAEALVLNLSAAVAVGGHLTYVEV